MKSKKTEQKLAQQIGGQLRRLRIQKGLTQLELAEKAGIGLTYLSKIEQGVRIPSVKTCFKLAKALKIELWEIFNFKGKVFKDKKDFSKKYIKIESALSNLSDEEFELIFRLTHLLARSDKKTKSR